MRNKSAFTDDQLVKSYINGDNEAFDILLCRYQDSVFTYILRIVKDSDLADDLFQETFVKAIINIKQNKYSGEGRFGAWVTRIARNLVVDFFRHEKNVVLLSTDDDVANMLNRKDLSIGTVEDDFIREQVIGDVQTLVHGLPADQRAVVEMRYYHDMSFKEIAALTGVSINTALGRMRYALLNMRRRATEANMSLAH